MAAIVVAVVIVGAMIVAVIYGIRKTIQLHDSVSAVIIKQQEELENSTVVFGIDEFVRPIDAV